MFLTERNLLLNKTPIYKKGIFALYHIRLMFVKSINLMEVQQMQNDLMVFQNQEFGEVRSVMNEGEPWFLGKDIAENLGYRNGSRDINRHVDNEDKLTERIVLSGQNRETIFINESGLYSLILSSKLPNARKFKRWVTGEVLPSIRNKLKKVLHRTNVWCII